LANQAYYPGVGHHAHPASSQAGLRPPPIAPARSRQETFDWVAEAHDIARGLVGDVRASVSPVRRSL